MSRGVSGARFGAIPHLRFGKDYFPDLFLVSEVSEPHQLNVSVTVLGDVPEMTL